MRYFTSLAWFAVFSARFAHSFDFQVGTTTQCDDLTVNWSGGTPPFALTVVVPGGDNLGFNIPSNAFQNNNGAFKTQLPVASGTQILLSMSDSTGPLSGGTSQLLVVGSSLTGATCNTTLPANDFFFSVGNSTSECGPYPFTQFTGADLPITIFFYVPGGHESFAITPPSSDSFTWNTNLTAQTHFVTTMIDSQNRRGGTDVVKTVSPSNDQSCINPNAISSPTSTTTSTTTPTPTPTPTPTQKSSSLSTGAIVGIAVGAVAVIVLLALLAICLIRRRKSGGQRTLNIDLIGDEPAGMFVQGPPAAIGVPGPRVTSQPVLSQQYLPNAYPAPVALMNQQHMGFNSNATFHPPSASSVSGRESSNTAVSHPTSKGSSSSKAAPSRRLVVHRDAEEELEELPPEYSDRRAPIESPSMQEMGMSSGSSRTPDRSKSTRKG